jgi:hypothetical protein
LLWDEISHVLRGNPGAETSYFIAKRIDILGNKRYFLQEKERIS